MSLLTALGYYLGGQGKAKQQRFDNEQAMAKDRSQADYQQQSLAETKRMDDSQIASTQAATTRAQADLDLDKNQRAFEAGLKLDPNWSKLTDAQKISYLQKRMSAAMTQRDDVVVAQTQKMIDGIPLQAQREAKAWYDTTERPAEFKASLAQKENALKQTLGERYFAVIREAETHIQIAGMNDQSRREVATLVATAAMNRTLLQQRAGNYRAQLGANSRMQVAITNDDARQGLQEYMQAEQNARRGALPGQPLDPSALPLAPPPVSAAPQVNYYLAPGDQQQQQQYDLGGLPPVNSQAAKKPPLAVPPVIDPAIKSEVSAAQAAIAAGAPRDAVIKRTRERTDLTPEQRQAILRLLGSTAPLPLPAGGMRATGTAPGGNGPAVLPFSLPR